jgi:hypothetical protein
MRPPRHGVPRASQRQLRLRRLRRCRPATTRDPACVRRRQANLGTPRWRLTAMGRASSHNITRKLEQNVERPPNVRCRTELCRNKRDTRPYLAECLLDYARSQSLVAGTGTLGGSPHRSGSDMQCSPARHWFDRFYCAHLAPLAPSAERFASTSS